MSHPMATNRSTAWRYFVTLCFLPLAGLALVALSTPHSTAQAETTAQERLAARSTNSQEKPAAEDRSSRGTAKSKGELTFDDLKFEMEKGGIFKRSMLTKEIEELNKKEIRIRGYILPASVFKQSGIQEFVLVRDNMECCFGPGAMLYDCIMIEMEKGKTADFTTRPIAVKGKFEVKEYKYPDSEEHYAIYRMIASEAK
jgi:hypothetical protein